ncbi:MAG: DUF6288 domain-containing protein [Lentisphaeria bacterium]
MITRQLTKVTFLCMLGYLGVWIFPASFVSAQIAERDAEAAKQAARGNAPELQEPERPAHMPDLTTRDKLSEDARKITWNMGPTGIIGVKNGGMAGDQVRVLTVMPGSPAEGHVKPGDVILGVGGKDFKVGGHLGRDVANAIIEAEEPENKGILKMHIWRDRNWGSRNNAKEMSGLDIEELFKKAEEDADLYKWKDEKEKAVAATSQAYDEYPIDGVELKITLQLTVMGTYSDTSPWDCPVAAKIRENAWKLLATKLTPDKRGRTRGRWIDAIALVASGKPEYRKLVHDWARKQKICRDMDVEPRIQDLSYKGMQSWYHGFAPLEMAIYYDATGDEYVLPELRKRAIRVAKGQNRGGSWGHTFAFPSFNGGELHGRNPGYGAMNNAGTRCFFLLTLAQKAGIEHPEIDLAIKRASRFFGTYVDKGCIPYGFHAPGASSDDSNGKNYGAAYAFYVLGKKYEAKYFSMLSAHASFTRRSGHGSPTLWHYTPMSANIAGPRGARAAMRNMRWFYTLARRHDGSFVMQGEQAGIGGKPSRSPTATYVMYYSAPFKQLVTTGKDADESFWFTDEELEELLISARPQIGDPALLERIGKAWKERATDELFDLLDHWYPNKRRAVAKELSKRYKAGEKNIAPRLGKLLDSEEARYRDGALFALMNCNDDVLKKALPKIKELLNDPAEFIRMRAVSALAKATEPDDPERQRLLLQAAAEDYPGMSTDVANVRTAVKKALFGGGSGTTKLHTAPFETGLDKDLVRTGLEKIVIMDPGGIVPFGWNKGTVTQLAGPIVYVAEEKQFNDAMFGGARTKAARKKLESLGVREMVECDLINTMKHSRLERDLARTVTFVHSRYRAKYGRYMNPALAEKFPGAYREFLPELRQVLQDKPLTAVIAGEDRLAVPLGDLIHAIETNKESQPMPSLADKVNAMFKQELDDCADSAEKIALCREELENPDRKNYFRMTAAMSSLVDILGPEKAVKDLIPYFGHQQWRVRRHARVLGLEVIKKGFGKAMIAAVDAATGEHAAAILMILADAGVDAARKPAREALQHNDPVVRKAAIETLAVLGGEKVLPQVFAFMAQATDPDDLRGCEQALLSHTGEENWNRRVSKKATAMLPNSTRKTRRLLYWVLAQIGGAENLATLKNAAVQAAGPNENKDDKKEFNDIAIALSYSPDRDADNVFLTLARKNGRKKQLIAKHSVRRMVTGPDDIGHVSDDTKLDLAVPLVKMTHNRSLISYMGQIHRGRCVKALSEIMKKGAAETTAPAIIAAAEGMQETSAKERKTAAEALRNVIEYIEVTRLRGGISEHMEKTDRYLFWKNYQTRAGKILLKLDKPEEAPMPGFDDMDLDL